MIMVEGPSHAFRRLLSSIMVAVLLSCILFLAILASIDLLPPQYRLIGGVVGLAIMVLGSIRIIRRSRAKYLNKTAPKLMLLGEVSLSFLKNMLSEGTWVVTEEYPNNKSFNILHSLIDERIPIETFAKDKRIDLLNEKLSRLRRLRKTITSYEEYSPEEIGRYNAVNRQVSVLLANGTDTGEGTDGQKQ